jgi:nucleotide-binding universal stress UspA family protein
MTYRVILAVLEGNEQDDAVLGAAIAAAAGGSTHVSVVHVRGDATQALAFAGVDSALLVGELLANAEKEIDAAAQRARQRFEAWQKGLAGLPETVTTEWEVLKGALSRVIAEKGTVADLIVAQMRPQPILAGFDLAEAALFETGRPVLMVPNRIPADLASRPMLAWKTNPQAARALAGALPLLTRAGRVLVFAANDSDVSPAAPTGVLPYLERHGIAAETRSFAPGADSVGAALLADAARAGATLLVLGAYGHSRLRELVLGGVTRHVLEEAPIPVLMAH